MAHTDFAQPCLLRLRHVVETVRLSRSQIYSLIAKGRFPKAIRLSERTVAWDSLEIKAWIAARIAERDSATIDSREGLNTHGSPVHQSRNLRLATKTNATAI